MNFPINENELRPVLHEKAAEQTIETLPDFMRECMDHIGETIKVDMDAAYGSVVVAMGAIMMAAFKAANKMEYGGLSGFQASALTWEIVPELTMTEKGPMRIIAFSNMLYPQYDYQFETVLSLSSWRAIQEMASDKLKADDAEAEWKAGATVRKHWLSIVAGEVPFGWTIRDDEDDEASTKIEQRN